MNILYSKTDNTLKIIKDEEVMTKLYYGEAAIPSTDQIKLYLKTNQNKQIKNFFTNDHEKDIQTIKDTISKINYIIPLYDEYTKNMFLVNRNNIYKNVVYLSFRFPDDSLITKLKDIKKNLEPQVEKLNKNSEKIEDLIKIRQFNKLKLILQFLKNFNIDILFETYVKTFYFYSDQVGGDLTICVKPSFMPYFKHIKPYYTKKELINLGKNMELKISFSDINKLCEIIKKNDVSAEIILNHQIHIINENMLGLIQYYSLQGSYFMNKYLRDQTPYKYKNEFLEVNIKKLWKCINDAPAFDKSYILYRFISSDEHIKHLKIGDEYIDDSFISTTRDPFYLTDSYKFGFILIKIKIPANKKGIALCMETISHFQSEEEVIFPPLTVLKLIKKDQNALYYHPNEDYASKIETRYEFLYMDSKKISFMERPPLKNTNTIDFLSLEKPKMYTISERINYFVNNYADDMFQIKTKIGDKEYTVVLE